MEIVHALPDRDELVERYRPLVNSIVGRILRSLPVQVEFQEAVSYGIVGLLEAADRFDPRRKVSFVTFSYYRIRGSVFDGLREMGILTRTPNDNWVRREVALNDLVQTAIDDETERPSGSVDDEIRGVVKYVDSLVPAYLLSLSAETPRTLRRARNREWILSSASWWISSGKPSRAFLKKSEILSRLCISNI